MALTRRQLIAAAGGAAAAHALLPAVARVGPAFGKAPVAPSAARRNRLVVLFLTGGNDGLNTIVPRGGSAYDVYRKVRPTLAVPPSQTRALTKFGDADHGLGINTLLPNVFRMYHAGRLAVVQGVDSPSGTFSHFQAIDNWHTGDVARHTGWLGRHLDRVGMREGELRAVGIGTELPLLLRGAKRKGVQVKSIAATRFKDGAGVVADARHDALALFENHAASEPLRRYAGKGARDAVDLVDVFARMPAAPSTGVALADRMLTARALLGMDVGVECVYLVAPQYDTHTEQKRQHTERLRELDAGIEAFFFGTVKGKPTGAGRLSPLLDSRTVLMVVSEFGRRIGENGSGALSGTDHGAAGPILLFGPAGRGANRRELVPGLHGDHPPLGSVHAPADNLRLTTDLRRVIQAVLEGWLDDPDPLYRRLGPLPGLFR